MGKTFRFGSEKSAKQTKSLDCRAYVEDDEGDIQHDSIADFAYLFAGIEEDEEDPSEILCFQELPEEEEQVGLEVL